MLVHVLGPLVGSLHHFLGARAEVAEDGTHHHAGQERGEADMYAATNGVNTHKGAIFSFLTHRQPEYPLPSPLSE